MIDWIAGDATERQKPLAGLADDGAVDLVISANILSQLALPVKAWLDAAPDIAKKLPSDIGRRLIDWHLDDLEHLSGKICLLTDTGYRELDEYGKRTSEHDLLHGHILPAPDASWDWPVAPRGELGNGTTHIHSACGFATFTRRAGK
jgi:hypothetical protein